MSSSITSKQLNYLNALLDDARANNKAQRAVDLFNQITGGDEANIGSSKGSGTGLRKRLSRITLKQAAALIDALHELNS